MFGLDRGIIVTIILGVIAIMVQIYFGRKKREPRIELSMQDEQGHVIEILEVSVIRYPPLNDLQIEEIVKDAKAKFPMILEFGAAENPEMRVPRWLEAETHITRMLGGKIRFEPPSSDEIREYHEQGWPDWLKRIEEFFRELHIHLHATHRDIKGSISIINNGKVPAEDALLELELTDNLNFQLSEVLDGTIDAPSHIIPPDPPSPPKGRWISEPSFRSATIQMIDDLRKKASIEPRPYLPVIYPLPGTPRARDRYSFYRKSENPLLEKKKWIFDCIELRHKVTPKIIAVIILVPNNDNISGGALNCLMTAKNMADPVKYTLPIRFHYIEGNTMAEAKRFIKLMKE